MAQLVLFEAVQQWLNAASGLPGDWRLLPTAPPVQERVSEEAPHTVVFAQFKPVHAHCTVPLKVVADAAFQGKPVNFGGGGLLLQLRAVETKLSHPRIYGLLMARMTPYTATPLDYEVESLVQDMGVLHQAILHPHTHYLIATRR